jgi:hypothetical protein
MSNRVAIKYMGFWDVPRIFIARHGGQTFLFDCAFDEGLDDYPDTFKVYLLPDVPDHELPRDWTTLVDRAARYLGEVPVKRVLFDPTKRQSIDSMILDEITTQNSAAG